MTQRKLMQNFVSLIVEYSANTVCMQRKTTGALDRERNKPYIHKFLPGHLGGIQQLSSQIESNQIDLFIFFRDPLTPRSHEPSVSDIVKMCDMYNIPAATNIATAEALILALDRGDLDWREMYK